MIAVINGVTVMGSPEEIKQYQELNVEKEATINYRVMPASIYMSDSNKATLRVDEEFSKSITVGG